VGIISFLKLNAHPLVLNEWASGSGYIQPTAGNEIVFAALLFLNLVEAARFGYFQVGLLIASQESIAIYLCGPTPHRSLMLFAPLRHQFAHVQPIAVSGCQ
jgi:hypothetical protein